MREGGDMGEGREKVLEEVSLISPACFCGCGKVCVSWYASLHVHKCM